MYTFFGLLRCPAVFRMHVKVGRIRVKNEHIRKIVTRGLSMDHSGSLHIGLKASGTWAVEVLVASP